MKSWVRQSLVLLLGLSIGSYSYLMPQKELKQPTNIVSENFVLPISAFVESDSIDVIISNDTPKSQSSKSNSDVLYISETKVENKPNPFQSLNPLYNKTPLVFEKRVRLYDYLSEFLTDFHSHDEEFIELHKVMFEEHMDYLVKKYETSDIEFEKPKSPIACSKLSVNLDTETIILKYRGYTARVKKGIGSSKVNLISPSGRKFPGLYFNESDNSISIPSVSMVLDIHDSKEDKFPAVNYVAKSF